MLFCTFNSEAPASRPSKAAWGLLLLVALLLVAAELATRYVVAPRSAIQSRIARELDAARRLKEGDVLFVGNSLLLWGADATELHRLYADRWRFHRFVVEGTSFDDWLFGLKQLIDGGSRPSAVFLVLSSKQVAQHSVLGDYFARQLMAISDLPAVASQLDLHPTTVASLALANQSAYYGLRGELRKALLLSLMPGLQKLFGLVNRQLPVSGAPSGLDSEHVHHHIAALRRFQTEHGIPVILVIPPLLSDPLAGPVRELARQNKVRVVTPLPAGALDPDLYSDGFHLNVRGQKIFTPVLARETLRILALPLEHE